MPRAKMKKLDPARAGWVALLICFCLFQPGKAQVYLSGPLSGVLPDTTYIIEDTISVEVGDSLVIEPGAVFLFADSVSFFIYGHLQAIGTAADSIYFLPQSDTTSWGSIIFQMGSSHESALSYCYISGASASAINCYYVNITISNCTITGNAANWGGGIYCSGSNAAISECVITDNQCKNNGGGIYCTNSSPTITDCIIAGNLCNTEPTTSSGMGGGGVCANHSSSPIITGCTIQDNHSIWHGGGVSINDNSNVSISDCLLSGNSADSSGGGLACFAYSYPQIVNCTFGGDSAAFFGGGIFISRSQPVIKNVIVADSRGDGAVYFADSLEVSVSYSAFHNPQTANLAGMIPANLGQIVSVNANGDSCDVFYNIFLDPLLVNPALDDYRLQWGSPCIDAGDPDPVYNDPDGTTADMGRYYYDQSIPVSILLTPHGVPIEIPAQGGSFDYTIQATNIGAVPLPVTVWCDITLPNGQIYGPVLGPVSVTVNGGTTISRERTQAVPAGAPAGTYSYHAYAVAVGDTSSDSFAFVKLGSEGMDCLSVWANFGEPFESSPAKTSGPTVPEAYALHQNFPNPFNARTVIRFSLHQAGRVELTIFDLQGRTAAQPILGMVKAGTHQVTWDASSQASGTYFCRIQAGNFTEVRKMVLVK